MFPLCREFLSPFQSEGRRRQILVGKKASAAARSAPDLMGIMVFVARTGERREGRNPATSGALTSHSHTNAPPRLLNGSAAAPRCFFFRGRCCFMARLAPRRPEKPRQTISNRDLVSRVCSRQQSRSLSLSLPGFYFSESLLEGNCHVFMSKARFYLFVFPGA